MRCLLGHDSVADKKCEVGSPLTVLGLRIKLDSQGICCFPDAQKVRKWLKQINLALSSGFLTAGFASKLAGGLGWAATAMFRKLGRAMLAPLYWHTMSRSSAVTKKLGLCLRWWRQVLACNIVQYHPWHERVKSDWVQVFADASSSPAHLGVVVVMGREFFYTDWAVPDKLLSVFQTRRDKQIMGLELLAIALAMGTFAEQLRGKRVRVWSDNTGSESAVRKGKAKAFDHGCIAHCIWLAAAELGIELRIDRVPTASNIADLPSRREYDWLNEMRAVWIKPLLRRCFWEPEAWESLDCTVLQKRYWGPETCANVPDC